MGKVKWTSVAAVLWATFAAYAIASDQADKGIVCGLIAVCFAILSLNER